jgi:ribosomal protein L17
MLGGGYFYYTDTQNKLALLQQNNANLKVAAEANQETINRMQSDALAAQEQMQKLSERAKEAEKYQDELIGKLRRHNLTALALQKPGMIETRINNATTKIFDQLENDTNPNYVPPSE